MAQTANFLAFVKLASQKACPTPQTATPHFVWERSLLRLATLLFFANTRTSKHKIVRGTHEPK